MFFRKQKREPLESPRVVVSLVEYVDQESGKKHWDVHRRHPGLTNVGYSLTDDYGYQTQQEAVAAYQRCLAIERGEIKVGLAKYTIDETVIKE